MVKVFLGIGHGGSDPGAVANGLREKDINLVIGQACRAELERHGVTVLMSRTKDENDTVNDVVKECNAFKPDLAADIHVNAGGGNGFEAYYHHKGGMSKTLAANIEKEVKALGQNSRGLKTKLNSAGNDYFGFIRSISAPAVILEGAFIDNKADIAFIDTVAEQQALGRAYAHGILKTLSIKVVVATTAPAPWYQEAKNWATSKGITDGTRPNDTATRAEVWAMLHRLHK